MTRLSLAGLWHENRLPLSLKVKLHKSGYRMSKTEHNILSLPSQDDIEVQAAEWLVVLGRDHVGPQDRMDFQNWIQKSAKHRDAFENLSGLWDDMAILKELSDIAEAAPKEGPSPDDPSRWYRFARITAAAAMLVFAVYAILPVLLPSGEDDFEQASFVAAVGEQQTVTLSDGSVVYINTNSAVDIDYTAQERSVRLNRGEAHFDVAHDEDRPFVVKTPEGAVRAVGTAFTVRLQTGDRIEVTVEEGRVALERGGDENTVQPDDQTKLTESPATVLAELTAGQSAVFKKSVEAIEHMDVLEVRRKLSWREGVLIFNGMPLADVVSDISRYTNVHIEITDPDVASIPIGGYFRVGEVDALFDALEKTFGLHVDVVAPDHLRISKRAG